MSLFAEEPPAAQRSSLIATARSRDEEARRRITERCAQVIGLGMGSTGSYVCPAFWLLPEHPHGLLCIRTFSLSCPTSVVVLYAIPLPDAHDGHRFPTGAHGHHSMSRRIALT